MDKFLSDGCTGIPDLNMGPCCVKHDWDDFIGVPDMVADYDFFICLCDALGFGMGGAIIASTIVCGMMVLRPFWRFYKNNMR